MESVIVSRVDICIVDTFTLLISAAGGYPLISKDLEPERLLLRLRLDNILQQAAEVIMAGLLEIYRLSSNSKGMFFYAA